MKQRKTWLVTGASQGLGLALVKQLLATGHRVAATSRNVDRLINQLGASDRFLPLSVDIGDEASVGKAVADAIETFGHIDVLVNNAGYGQLGTVEEVNDAEVRRNFDANVFGLLNVMRAVTPHLRNRGSGRVINISSIVGFYGAFGGWGIYNATKFAVAGLTEAFAAEIHPFGVHVTVVYPGYFRTNFLRSGSLKTAENQVTAYTDVRESERVHIEEIAGKQPGSPEKAAAAIAALADLAQPPLHLFLGSDSLGLAKSKLDILQRAISANEDLSKSTDY